jgi:hypothetical protein
MRPDRRRDVVEAAPYGEFIRRALRAYGRRVGDGEIEELRELVRLRDDLEHHRRGRRRAPRRAPRA